MKAKRQKFGKRGKGWILGLAMAGSLLGFATETFAQPYEVSLRQRRLGSQIGVEVWVRSLSASSTALGDMSIAVTYNTSNLTPADPDEAVLYATDSIDSDVNQSAPYPYRSITSSFNSGNGYQALAAQAISANGINVYQLDVRKAATGAGIIPSSTGRGSFIGMLRFDIANYATLTSSSLSGIDINTNTSVGDFRIFDYSGNDVESQTSFVATPTLTIKGITILNPNGGEAVNRNKTYSSLSTSGYPIYLERSGLISAAAGREYGTPYLAYAMDYSTDNGVTWQSEVLRFAEEREDYATLNVAGDVAEVSYGEIKTSDGTNNGYYVTQGDGSQLPVVTGTGYKGILRIVWEPNSKFISRSEQARLRIFQLDTTNAGSDINSVRTKPTTNPYDISDNSFVLSRLFFTQLDGTSKYLKTRDNYSNATQLTVEAWINLNSIQADGSEPGIVVTGPGPNDANTEGAWMLYLKDGKYPAFRAKEIQGGAGRGQNGGAYIATVISPDALTATSDATPINSNTAHPDNWHHIAATVENNIVNLYVDGELKAYYTNDNAINIRMATMNHPVWVGVNPTGGINANDYLHAGIKEIRVWRKALSQDTIRMYMAGVASPANNDPNDVRSALELYYDLQASNDDKATETIQNGTNPIYLYTSAAAGASATSSTLTYRPDRAHVRITSPATGAGVSNIENAAYEVRYSSYGFGDNSSTTTGDLVIEFTKDNGANWVKCIDNDEPGNLLDSVQIETGYALWEPFKHATVAGAYNDLQALLPTSENYVKNVKLRIRGTENNEQETITSESGTFIVAPHFALENNGSTVIAIPEGTSLNLSGSTGFIEAWVRPYRMPTEIESAFPIVGKMLDTNNLHYSFNLMRSGRLQFIVTDANGQKHYAYSDATKPVEFASQLNMDSTWTHVGVFFNLANGSGQSTVIFYIDGNPQSSDTNLTYQLGANLNVPTTNTWKTYIASEPAALRNFYGAIKEVRIWNGSPADMSYTGAEPTNLTNFIRGALCVRASELDQSPVDYTSNLAMAISFDGNPLVIDGYANKGALPSIYATSTTPIFVQFESDLYSSIKYVATQPLFKVVEPVYKQLVPNSTTALTVRWVGFDFDRNMFRTGDDVTATTSDLEWSANGGGNTLTLPYSFTSSKDDNSSWSNSFALPMTNNYRFSGISTNPPFVQFGGALNVSLANADEDLDGNRTDQGVIPSTLSNGRLRLMGRSSINYPDPKEYTDFKFLRAESPLFTITPSSNFTVRALLEGYHNGSAADMTGVLGTAYSDGGFLIKLYSDNNGAPGSLIAQAYSSQGYSQTDPLGSPAVRGTNSSLFANVPLVFDSIADGKYWVVVDHRNHLPVMSRHAATFAFDGGADITSVWNIASGWDFQAWNGSTSNIMTEDLANSMDFSTSPYTAYGSVSVTPAESTYAATALIYNNGVDGISTNALASMVGGDVVKDGQINAADRTYARAALSDNMQADVTGDGEVTATDRTIVDRNFAKTSSLVGMSVASIMAPNKDDIYSVVPDFKPEMAQVMNNLAKTHDFAPAQKDNKVKNNQTLAAENIKYKVSGSVELKDGFVDLSLYVQNEGSEFAWGNCTFSVKFDNKALAYQELVNIAEVPWSNKPTLGYISEVYSAPIDGYVSNHPDVRSIEINYDAYTRPAGFNVPNSKTLLGTLRFKVVNPQDVYEFSWFTKTLDLHRTDGTTITNKGVFMPIEPVNTVKKAIVMSPNGGESWKSGREYSINWTAPSKATTVWVEFSSDNAKTWTRLNSTPIDVMGGNFAWIASKIKSSECVVRIIGSNDGIEIDRSDNNFAIVPASAYVTKPAAVDPIYHGGKTDAIRWTVEIPTNVKFEFSEDGVNNWQTVTTSVNSQNGQVSWNIPLVNTKKAVISMIDAKTNEYLAFSEPFKVLAGTLDFTSPSANDIVKPNETKNVRWNFANLNQFVLELSLDGGATWAVIGNATASKGAYVWKAPNQTSDHAIIRALWNGDPDMEYDRTDEFKLRGPVGVEEEALLTFNVSEPVPNPVEVKTAVDFTLPTTVALSAALYNAAGEKVLDIVNNRLYMNGAHTLNIDVANLVNGAYYLRINAGSYSSTKLINVVK